jgi:hypothetical protein
MWLTVGVGRQEHLWVGIVGFGGKIDRRGGGLSYLQQLPANHDQSVMPLSAPADSGELGLQDRGQALQST